MLIADMRWAQTTTVEIVLRLSGGGVPLPPPGQHHTGQLKHLARKHTKPPSLGPKFRPSAAFNTLRKMAKQGRNAEAWKQYRAALRKEKEGWREKRIERACSDWGTYKALTKPKKQWGEQYMASVDSEDPIGQIHQHFESVLLQTLAQDPSSLQAIVDFFDGILSSGEIPKDWDKSITTLLPKVVPPKSP